MSRSATVQPDPKTFDGPVEEDSGDIPEAQVAVKGRNVDIPDHFVARINAKLAKLERLAPTITRFEVELLHENNRRLAKVRQRVEITCRSTTGVARAEAGEDSFHAALESAVSKLDNQLRKARTRNTISRSGHRRPQSVAEATAELAEVSAPVESLDRYADEVDEQLPGRIVRRKEHDGKPMGVDDALERMELVGHDFYLFRDVETGRPTVVYRRHAFDYGLLTLSDES